MKFDVLLEELRSLNLPGDQFAVTSSGVMAVRGLREANDIDIVVTGKLWKKLASKYPVKKHSLGYYLSITKNIEVLGGRVGRQKEDSLEAERQIKNAEIIDGIRFVRLPDVKKFKERVERKKDIEDIKLIDEYLREEV